MRTDIKDITHRYHQGDIFSDLAHKTLIGSKAAIRAKVISYVRDQGWSGATSDEIEQATGLSHQTVSARVTEAKADGTLIPIGKRKTRSGRNAAVLVVKEYVA